MPIEVTSGYTQGCPSPTSRPTAVRRPLVRRGRLRRVHDRPGRSVRAPDGGPVQDRRTEGGTWDPANDPSYQAAVGPNPNVPLYEGGVRVWGVEPGPTAPDTVAPTAPGAPTASAVTSTGATLSWAPSTDTGGSGLAGYDRHREAGATDVLVGSPVGASLAITGLTPATAYLFYVVARDGAGNRSAASAPVGFTTAGGGGDTTPPGVPAPRPPRRSPPPASTLTWTASTDDVDRRRLPGLPGGRRDRRTGRVARRIDPYAVTGLTPATAYQFYVVGGGRGRQRVGGAPRRSAVTTCTSTPAGPCRIGYTTNDWSTGFSATVTITQHRRVAASTGWTLAFGYSAGQRITQAWSATVTQTGTAVTATNLSYNGTLAPGASTSFGFNGTHTGSNPRPHHLHPQRFPLHRDLTAPTHPVCALAFDGGAHTCRERVAVCRRIATLSLHQWAGSLGGRPASPPVPTTPTGSRRARRRSPTSRSAGPAPSSGGGTAGRSGAAPARGPPRRPRASRPPVDRPHRSHHTAVVVITGPAHSVAERALTGIFSSSSSARSASAGRPSVVR